MRWVTWVPGTPSNRCRLIEELVQRAAALQCYKVILDCGEHNVPFYAKCGLVQKEVQMVRYFDR